MLLQWLAVVAGLILLVWSADRFVIGASVTAEKLGVPVLVIGMLLMGFGTSAPEMLVAIQASLDGSPDLAVGNALGSNIANIALILGLTALIAPIPVATGLVRKEIPLLLVVTLGAALLLLNQQLDWWKGVLLVAGLLAFIGYSYWLTRQGQSDALLEEVESTLQPMSTARALFWLLVGLVLLVVSSRLLVWGAVELALSWGVSEMVVGLTLVAVGTSLPELAASLAAARKGQAELVLGNIIGSNVFNLLAVLPMPALLASGSQLGSELLWRDLPVMLGLTVLLLLVSLGRQGQERINRMEGAGLLLCFVGYQGWLFLGS
ncbi:calcium/sodium antiporter [Marinospirillum sp.]|uniref:calcium/sodium antiporter n=1 Tax=Marinospirillum sp. TaxID=2183934 RepID=UPI0028700F84|nr:calcium/sodium antiporter [Marinospirillum sp.]MDR9467766.1 calcium/sodium antiporter [Marinospirillum sp.]